jgi:Sec-independent protein translocase protein TatA
MEFLGIGPLELLLIFVLALILLGPKDMVATAKKAAAAIRKLTQSEVWKDAVDSSREIRQFPTQIMKDTGLEDELRKINRDLNRSQEEVIWEKDMEKARSQAPASEKPEENEPSKNGKGDPDGGS